MFVVKLETEQERDTFVGLLDMAVKAGGIRVAESALAIIRRIQKEPEPASPEAAE